MTPAPSLAQLEAAIAEREAANERDRAKIAAMGVDPLLIEAREICGRRDIDFYAEFKEGKYDAQPAMLVALAALRRGMELASAPVDAVDALDVEALAVVFDALEEAASTFQRYCDLHAAKETPEALEKARTNFHLAERMRAALAIRATLAHRGARWPGNDELRDMIAAAYHAGATDVHRAWEQGLQGAADDLGEGASDYAANVLGEQP